MNHSGIPIFRYGELRLTKGVDKLISHHAELLPYIAKHITGDWGVLALDDKQSNDEALQFGGRLLSVYMFKERKIWVMTEADRRSTVVLLPEEY